MSRILVIAALLVVTPAAAAKLSCAQNASTFETMCFAKNGVRQNGDVRAAKIYRGGPNNVEETSYTARVHCRSRVLELTDRNGVAFARNVPAESLGRDFVQFLCDHTPTKRDPKLKTN